MRDKSAEFRRYSKRAPAPPPPPPSLPPFPPPPPPSQIRQSIHNCIVICDTQELQLAPKNHSRLHCLGQHGKRSRYKLAFFPLRRVDFHGSMQRACSRRTTSARLSCHTHFFLIPTSPPLPTPPPTTTTPPTQAGEFNVLLAEAITSGKSASITQVVLQRYCAAAALPLALFSLTQNPAVLRRPAVIEVTLLCLCPYSSPCLYSRHFCVVVPIFRSVCIRDSKVGR